MTRTQPPVIRVHTSNRVFSRVEIVSPEGIFVLPGVVKVEQSIAVNDAVRVTIEMLATVEVVPNSALPVPNWVETVEGMMREET